MIEDRARVGIGVLIFRDDQILLGRRIGSHAPGMYASPGGHLEYLESFADCATRETLEETGIEITNIRFLAVTNLKDYASKHYVDIGLIADWKSGEPKVMEPEKCEGWDWYPLDRLPEPLFATVHNYITALETKNQYFDAV